MKAKTFSAFLFSLSSWNLSPIGGIVMILVLLISLISVVLTVVPVVGMWKMFVKAGEPGWAIFVPFYNLYIMFKISYGNGWKFLFMMIPFVGFVFMIINQIKLAQAFGKGTGFAVGLIFLQPIFVSILGFGDAQYLGPVY